MNIGNIKIYNPVTHGTNDFKIIRTFKAGELVAEYHNIYNFDISDCFAETKEVFLYRCNTTGFEFYAPFTVAGNDKFYQNLQKISWYYQSNRWEFDVADKEIASGCVLDIGCGEGSFLDKVKHKVSTYGLELNSAARDKAEKKGHQISGLYIEGYAKDHIEKFDYVTAFQVLEHIYDVKEFVLSALKVIKKGGILFISVPNNQVSYFKTIDFSFDNEQYKRAMLLNMPPHHMGRWTASSFRKAAEIWDATIESIRFEPVKPWRTNLKRELLIRDKYYAGLINYLPAVSNVVIKRLSPDDDTMLIAIRKK